MSATASFIGAIAVGALSLFASAAAKRIVGWFRGDKDKELVVQFEDGREERLHIQANAASDEITTYVKDYIRLESDVQKALMDELRLDDLSIKHEKSVDFLVSSKHNSVALEVKMNGRSVNKALIDNIMTKHPDIKKLYILVGSDVPVSFTRSIKEKIDSGKLLVKSVKDIALIAMDIKRVL